MSLHVIVENRNTKMPHTGFPQWAQTLTDEKADRSLFSHRGKDQPPFLPSGQAAGRGPGKSLVAALAQSPPSSSLAASAEGLKVAGTPSTDCPDNPGLSTCWSPHRPRDPTGTCSEEGRSQAPAGTLQGPLTPTHGSAAPWAHHR